MKIQNQQLLKKYFYGAVIATLTATLPLVARAQTQTEPKLGPNLLKNAGFENDAANWNIPADSAKVVEDVAHGGSHSLHYKNDSEKRYKLFSQKLDVKPGQLLNFSVWVKGKEVVSGDSGGAGIYVQSYAGGKFIGGAYPSTLNGTFGWKRAFGEYTVPPNATSTSVGLYLRKGATGEVWFDDAEVRIEEPAAFKTFLQYPNYRGLVKQGDSTPWKYRVQINRQENWGNKPVKIVTTLKDSQGKVLLTDSKDINITNITININPMQDFLRDKSASENSEGSQGKVLLGSSEDVNIAINPPQDLPLGKYTLEQTITNPNGEAELRSQNRVEVTAEMPKVYVDAQGFTVVDGERFFPLGVYLGPTDDENLERIADGGYNTILAYGYGSGKNPEAYMMRAQKHGLKVVYSVKDMYPGKAGHGDDAPEKVAKYLKMMRDEPALLAWYINDELGAEWMEKLRQTYDQVVELDPNHPALQVQNKLGDLEKDAEVTDILANDPYPVGSANLTRTFHNTRATVAAANGARGVWMVPQMMDWAVYKKGNKQHPPSLNEMRNQAYQAIINGAKGLIWYSYYDMMYEKYPRGKETTNMDLFHRRWADATTMASEINALVPTILHGDKIPLAQTGESDVQASAWEYDGELLIMLANPYYEQKSITLTLPVGWNIKDTNQGQIKSTFADGKATFTLPSIGSGVFKLTK